MVNCLVWKRSLLRLIGFEINYYFDEFKGLIFIFLRNSEIFKWVRDWWFLSKNKKNLVFFFRVLVIELEVRLFGI